MKKIIIQFIILFFFCPSSNLFSQMYQYTEQNSGVTVNLTSVSLDVLADNYLYENAWACGIGTVIKTFNNGTNWINVSGSGLPININLVNIFGIDSNTSLTAGNIGTSTYLYRTTNKGVSWVMVFSQTNGSINAVNITSTLTGFMVGNPVGGRWSLWKTTNGGVSWDSTGLRLVQTGTETGFNNSLSIVGNMIWFGTNNSRIYYSTNFGTNWQTLSTSPEINSRAVWFYQFDPTFGYIGGTNIYETTNYGFNWTAMTCQGTGNFGGFTWGEISESQFMPPYLSWAVRNDSIIYLNVSYSSSWQPSYYAPSGVYRHVANSMGSKIYSWAVRSNGGITRFIVFLGEVKKLSSEVPDKFSLSQNYPNPFNPTTKIQYCITVNDFVQLKIYDVLGHFITSLVNERETPGTYEVVFDAGKYSSGLYFYKLQAGTFTETKKLLLIK